MLALVTALTWLACAACNGVDGVSGTDTLFRADHCSDVQSLLTASAVIPSARRTHSQMVKHGDQILVHKDELPVTSIQVCPPDVIALTFSDGSSQSVGNKSCCEAYPIHNPMRGPMEVWYFEDRHSPRPLFDIWSTFIYYENGFREVLANITNDFGLPADVEYKIEHVPTTGRALIGVQVYLNYVDSPPSTIFITELGFFTAPSPTPAPSWASHRPTRKQDRTSK